MRARQAPQIRSRHARTDVAAQPNGLSAQAPPAGALAPDCGAVAPAPFVSASTRGHGRHQRDSACFDLATRRTFSSRLTAMARAGRLSFLFFPKLFLIPMSEP